MPSQAHLGYSPQWVTTHPSQHDLTHSIQVYQKEFDYGMQCSYNKWTCSEISQKFCLVPN